MWRHRLLRRWNAARAIKLGAEAAFLAAALVGVANGALQLRPPAGERPAAYSAPAITTAPNIGSPFDPWVGVARETAEAHAALASIRAIGVRVADDPARSGAVLSLVDRQQRLFKIGDEVALGARLTAVAFDHVVLERDGRLVRIEMSGWSPAPPPKPLRMQAPFQLPEQKLLQAHRVGGAPKAD